MTAINEDRKLLGLFLRELVKVKAPVDPRNLSVLEQQYPGEEEPSEDDLSTTEQTVENQQRELEAVAERHGWNVVAVFTDAGISGTKGRDKRPGYDCLCRGIARREFDQVSAWSVDRLGRSLQELVSFLGELHAKDVDLYLHQQGLDTSTPARDAFAIGRLQRDDRT